MPASKVKSLSSLFRLATKAASLPTEDVIPKQCVSALGTSSPTPNTHGITGKHLVKSSEPHSGSNNSSHKPLSQLTLDSLNSNAASNSEDSTKQLSREISSILCGDADFPTDAQKTHEGKPLESVLDIPWFSSISSTSISQRRKEVSRERKQKWIFKSTQTNRFDRLVRLCARKLGADATIQVFGKLGREAGVKEYNALMNVCLEKAKNAMDEEASLVEIYKAYQLFRSMREQGFPVEEESYGPLLVYLIEMGWEDDFQFFYRVIKDVSPNSLSRLAYYEMLLWIRLKNEDKIKELCSYIAVDDGVDKSDFRESYMLALCDSNSDRKKELLLLLDTVDITRVSLPDRIENIFKSLGRFSLESFVEKYIVAFKNSDMGAGNISNFIYNYIVSLPNLAVEDVILKFIAMHVEFMLTPSSMAYEKLIGYCCDSLKVHLALDIVDRMFEADLALTIETIHSILSACEESCEYNLVRQIYSVVRRHNLKPNNETFRSMIDLSVRMKDFDGAYDMIRDLKEMNLMPTTSMYNAIIAGYFREKKIHRGMVVLKEMEDADVKPNAQTFSYLIANCNSEEDIVKYYHELKLSGIQATKHVYMAIINAYAARGQFEKAKQVVLDKGVPTKSLNEVRYVLVSALATHGQVSDAMAIYEEIRDTECYLEPKTILCLIEHLQSDGDLGRLLKLLEELRDPDCWVDGCTRIILYCVRHKFLSTTIDLLKQLKDKFCNDKVVTEVLFDEVFCKIADEDATHLQFGMDLLQAVKEELQLRPSRKCLDFLLSACVNAKSLQTSFLIWKEYQTAGLPYNVLSFLRMYQALLASGDNKSANKMLNKISKDDPHVRRVIKACQATYLGSKGGKEKKKKKNKREGKIEL